MATAGTKPIIVSAVMFSFSCAKEIKEDVPFSMAERNGELVHERFPKHSRMRTARMNNKKRGMSMKDVKGERKEVTKACR